MRFELYSLICQKCGRRNSPTLTACQACGGPVSQPRRCPSCQSENPPNAYVCLRCYRILKAKPPVGFLHFHIPWPISVVVLCVATGWLIYKVFSGWVGYVSSQIELRTQQEWLYSNQKQDWESKKSRRHHALDHASMAEAEAS